jgi:hypothetical protein
MMTAEGAILRTLDAAIGRVSVWITASAAVHVRSLPEGLSEHESRKKETALGALNS